MQGLNLTSHQKEHIEISNIINYGQLYPKIYRLIEFEEISYIILRVPL